MKKVKRIICLALASVFVLLNVMSASAETVNFILDTEGQMIRIPEAYHAVDTIKTLQGNISTNSFNSPKDLYYSEGYLYVADTQNNRVLRMTKDGHVDLEISTFTYINNDGQTVQSTLNKPYGIWVSDETGEIRIADYGNLRIVVFDKNGKFKAMYGEPTSDAIDSETFTFDAQKLVVNSMGYMFALKGANIMKLNSKNEFLGYVGTVDVEFSFYRMLIRTFGSREQRERTEKAEPTSYNNFTIGRDDVMYGVLAGEATSGQIRRLNSVGDNTYPEYSFGFTMLDENYMPIEPSFHDITADEDGIVTVVDADNCLIYQYDAEGNLLTAFGGKGSRKGMYKFPCSIVVDEEGILYVLDSTANNIQILEPSNFINLVHQAITLQTEGEYSEAKKIWLKVLDIDANYSLAHKCVGKILYKEGKYKESQEHYKMANDKNGYSMSFAERRQQVLKSNFFIIVLIICVIVFIIGKIFVTIKRKADKWAFNIEMRGDMDK